MKKITFELSDSQLKKLNLWYKGLRIKHQDLYKDDKNPILEYTFSPNGIGYGIEVRDKISNEKIDLTDVSSW